MSCFQTHKGTLPSMISCTRVFSTQTPRKRPQECSRAEVFLAILMMSILPLVHGGCDDEGIVSPGSPNLFPLSIGNHWSYVQSSYMSGQVVSTDSFRLDIFRDMVVLTDEGLYQVMVRTLTDLSTNTPRDDEWLFWNGGDGLYLMGGRTSSDSIFVKLFLLKNPALSGDTWQVPRLVYYFYSGQFGIQDTLVYDCFATNEEMVTLVGTFTCTVFHHRVQPQPDVFEQWDYYEYYAVGVGPVATIVKSSIDGSLKFKTLLSEYSVN